MNRLFKWFGLSKHDGLKRNRRFFYDFNWNKPLEDYDFVVFDTELTGLKPRTDEIVSIGAVKVQNLRIAVGKNFFCYARPNQPLPKDSTLIHRITPSQVVEAPPLQDTLPDFINFVYGVVIVGHFVSIDLNFLNRATKNFMGGTIKNPIIDTMKMAQFYEDYRRRNYYEDPIQMARTPSFMNLIMTTAEPNFPPSLSPSFNLNYLAKKYGLPLFEKHDALEDAMQTAYLFLFLVKKLKSAGVLNLRDLYLAQGKSLFSSDYDSFSA